MVSIVFDDDEVHNGVRHSKLDKFRNIKRERESEMKAHGMESKRLHSIEKYSRLRPFVIVVCEGAISNIPYP